MSGEEDDFMALQPVDLAGLDKREVFKRIGKHDVMLAKLQMEVEAMENVPERVTDLEKRQIEVKNDLTNLTTGQQALKTQITDQHQAITESISGQSISFTEALESQRTESKEHRSKMEDRQEKQEKRQLWMGIILIVMILGGPEAIAALKPFLKALF